MDRTGHHRRPQPPSAADDGGGGIANTAAGARRDGRRATGRAGARPVARLLTRLRLVGATRVATAEERDAVRSRPTSLPQRRRGGVAPAKRSAFSGRTARRRAARLARRGALAGGGLGAAAVDLARFDAAGLAFDRCARFIALALAVRGE